MVRPADTLTAALLRPAHAGRTADSSCVPLKTDARGAGAAQSCARAAGALRGVLLRWIRPAVGRATELITAADMAGEG